MHASESISPHPTTEPRVDHTSPHIVVGITDAQTCLNLKGRLRALGEAGFRVTLVASPGKLLDQTAAEQGARAVALPIHRKIAPFSDLVSLVRLLRMLRRLGPDMTEFSTPKAGLLGTIAARIARVPVRVYMLRGFKFEGATGWKRRLLLATERVSAACAHVVLCNSQSMRAKALELGAAPAAKLALLGNGSTNGVNVDHFSPGQSHVREAFGIPRDAPVIGFVGRLTRDKGVPELVESFEEVLKIVPDARLLLVGWFDSAEDGLSPLQQACICSHPRIHCTGRRVEDPAPYYRAMDIFVLPTWREGFPNVVLEAGATGIPVVTTESTGSRDSVIPELTGLLIPPGSPLAITESVLKLLRDPQRRSRMGTAARNWVCENFSDAQVLGQVAHFYSTLVREERCRRGGGSDFRGTEQSSTRFGPR